MTIRIDGDIICYRAASATDGKHYLYRGEKYNTIDEMEMIHGKDFIREAAEVAYDPEPWSHCKRILDNLMKDYGMDKTYVGGKANFRYEVATIKDYKGNRTSTQKPKHIDAAKQYLIDEYGAKLPAGPWETDDQIALDMEEGDTLVTLDKDFRQLPNIKLKDTLTKKVTETTEQSALASLYVQVLTGDIADNIPGAYKCGPKSVYVSRIRKEEAEEGMLQICRDVYQGIYHNYADQFLRENLQLLYLLRSEGKDLNWVEALDATDFYKELRSIT